MKQGKGIRLVRTWNVDAKMTRSRFNDIKWWYWLATAMLLAAYLVAGLRTAIFAAIALTAGQLVHVAAREREPAAFPVQVRAAYLGLLMIGLYPPLVFIHWIQLAGTWAMVLVGYCPSRAPCRCCPGIGASR